MVAILQAQAWELVCSVRRKGHPANCGWVVGGWLVSVMMHRATWSREFFLLAVSECSIQGIGATQVELPRPHSLLPMPTFPKGKFGSLALAQVSHMSVSPVADPTGHVLILQGEVGRAPGSGRKTRRRSWKPKEEFPREQVGPQSCSDMEGEETEPWVR